MIIPTRGTYLCEIISRIKQLPSGLFLADKIKDEKNDNVARVIGVGGPAIKDCYLCHDKKQCKKKCEGKGKIAPMIVRRADIVHFKINFGRRLVYKGKRLISLTNNDLIAIERENEIIAVGSMVVAKIIRQNNVGSIILSDGANMLEGEFYGDVVSVGPDFPDKDLKKGDKLFYLRDEGYCWQSYYTREKYLSIKERWIYGKDV